jgi:CRP-like cAMP-binding protein
MSTPFLLQFLQIISENTAVLHERLAHVSQKGLRQRLTQYLVAESAKQQTQKIVLPLTKVRLAQLLGVSRTSLSREFTAMQKAGLLTYNRNIVKLSHFFEGCIF